MRAGNLRNYGEIKQSVESFDLHGELIKTYSHFAYAYAEILPLVGREYWSARQVVSEVTGKIKIRYIEGVNPKMIYVCGLKTYDIEAVIDVENRHRELVLLVKEL